MNASVRYDPLRGNPLPQYGDWSADDYRALGLKVGLEVHQQLLTRRKLFCRCPAGVYSKQYDIELLRHMRPTLSEMGDYDGTALMEFKTRKEITYQLNNTSVCTYEMDDAPPFEMDVQALDQSIAIAMMLELQVVDELHIARKQYLDGSIPTGFQRTAIIGINGSIPFNGREIGIRQLSIEEDSCREVSDKGHDRIYRTDRLGMPLIETVTEPEMYTPWDAAAVCEVVRRLTRASSLVRIGAGAGREDVNVSITGGTRIEIKGVSSIRQIPRLVHNEALRQRSLLAIRDVLVERGITSATIEDKSRDVTGLVQATDWRYIGKHVAGGARVAAVPLPGFEGLISAPTQPHIRFLKEFSDRVRVVACIDTLPNVICSTSETETLSSSEWSRIVKSCGVSPDTPVIVVWGRQRDVETAIGEILIRAREATLGIPEETRQSLPDGTTGFERVLPGASRMYPDTDLPPLVIDSERLDRIRKGLRKTPWQRLGLLRQAGVGEDLAQRMSIHPAFDLFEHLLSRLDEKNVLSPTGLASLLLDRDCPRPTNLAAIAWWETAIDALVGGQIIIDGLTAADNDPLPLLPEPEARAIFDRTLESLPDSLPKNPHKRPVAAMKTLMKNLRGRIPGALVLSWAEEAIS